MELKTTSKQYTALSQDSYHALAVYAAESKYTVTLHPEILTVVAPDEASREFGQYIDDNALDFHIEPIELKDDDDLANFVGCKTTDSETLRQIISQMAKEKEETSDKHYNAITELTKELESSKRNRDMYYEWYSDTAKKADRVKEQVKAIAVLVNSIFPEE